MTRSIATSAVSFKHKVEREREREWNKTTQSSTIFINFYIFNQPQLIWLCLLLLQRLKNEMDLIISFLNFRTLCLTFAKGEELQRNKHIQGRGKWREGGAWQATSLSRAALFNFSNFNIISYRNYNVRSFSFFDKIRVQVWMRCRLDRSIQLEPSSVRHRPDPPPSLLRFPLQLS